MDILSFSERERRQQQRKKKHTFRKFILCAIVLLCFIELSGMRVVAFTLNGKEKKNGDIRASEAVCADAIARLEKWQRPTKQQQQ